MYAEKGERYTADASALDMAITKVLEPIFKEWYEAGFKVRQIGQIMHGAVEMIMLETLLGWNEKSKST